MIKSLPAFCVLCALSSQTAAQSFVTMFDGDIYFSDSTVNKIRVAQSQDLVGGMSAKFQLQSGAIGNTGASDQNGSAFSHQTQMGVSGNWGALALWRSSNAVAHDSLAQDQISNNASKNVNDSLMALDIPVVHHTVFASYSDQNDQAGSTGSAIVKQITLAYTYPISRMTNLFIARIRLDNLANNPAPPSGFAGLGCRQIQFGLHHSF